MSRYYLIHRLQGPAVILLVGVLALLHQLGVINSFWHLFWPLLLITIGVLKLAERAALATEEDMPPGPFPGAQYPGPYQAPYPGPYSGPNQAPNQGAPYAAGVEPTQGTPGTAMTTIPSRELAKNPEGGQS